MAQILVVKPSTLTVGDKRKLRAAGVVTVEAEKPEEVRLITPEGPPMDGNDLFFAAMSAIASQKHGYRSDAGEQFAKAVHALLKQRRTEEEG